MLDLKIELEKYLEEIESQNGLETVLIMFVWTARCKKSKGR